MSFHANGNNPRGITWYVGRYTLSKLGRVVRRRETFWLHLHEKIMDDEITLRPGVCAEIEEKKRL